MRIGIQGFVKNNAKENYVQAWPCKNGFLWKVPRNSQIEYGVIANINEGYKIFNDFLKQNSINITNVKARIVPRGFSLPKTGNTTLCGDAMGLTKPWSGGGVVWGLIAADILIKSFPDFQTYAKKMKMFFIPKILISKILVKIVYFLGYYFPYLLPKTNNVESDFIF